MQHILTRSVHLVEKALPRGGHAVSIRPHTSAHVSIRLVEKGLRLGGHKMFISLQIVEPATRERQFEKRRVALTCSGLVSSGLVSGPVGAM